jgi:Icc-related predicted phosphoesterase
MIRVAAVGDIHIGERYAGRLRPHLAGVADRADVLLVAGDLTRRGRRAQAEVAAGELRDLGLPTVAVLGNHDHESDEPHAVTAVLEDAGITVLEGAGTVLRIGGTRVGVAGVKGFGGGFPGAVCADFGEPETKAFVRHGKERAAALLDVLRALDCDLKIALTHYAPVADTLVGERLEIYPFLGTGYLADAIDAGAAHFAVHGHAHAGTEEGRTAAGVPVRNVAQDVLRRPYAVYDLDTAGVVAAA